MRGFFFSPSLDGGFELLEMSFPSCRRSSATSARKAASRPRKRDDLILALDGRLAEHHRFLLAVQLRRLEAIEEDIAALDKRIGERLEPYAAAHALLMQMRF